MQTDPHLLDFLSDPRNYPEPTSRVTHVETHISHVFICDEFVYKLKKPLDLHFLDFSTLRRRGYYCRQEVALNSRLAPGVYLGRVTLYKDAHGYSFSKRGGFRPAEYAVKMRRLPQNVMLSHLIDEGRPLYGELQTVGDLLANFHSTAMIYKGAYGSVRSIRAKTEENFSQIAPFAGSLIDRAVLEELRQYTRRFIADNPSRFEERIKAGSIRDGHGDLHSQHVCMTRPPVIFDCIEFNRDFRIIDVLEDIAFLHMDLELRGRFDLSSRLHKAYFSRNQVHRDDEMLLFYKIYRAVVRGKVQGFLAAAPGDEAVRCAAAESARHYFDLLTYYLHQQGKPFNPLVFMGLSGSGKSTVAGEFKGERLIVRSDEIRKELSGATRTSHSYEDYGKGAYSPEKTAAVYEALAERVIDRAVKADKVVADATYLKASHRLDLYTRCMARGLNPLFVHCIAGPEILRQRVVKRMQEGTDVSDAHPEILKCQMRDQEDPSELPRFRVLRLNTEGSLHDLVMALREFL